MRRTEAHNSFLYNSYNMKMVKETIKLVIKLERKTTTKKYNINDYDLNHIIAYTCKGDDLIASKANTKNPNRHFLMGNNHYEVYEIPKKTNSSKFKFTGEFLVLFRNVEYGYWLCGYMNHELSHCYHSITENASFICFGEFDVHFDGDYCSIYCTRGEGSCCRGRKSSSVFDPDDIRKIRGYGITRHDMAKFVGLY